MAPRDPPSILHSELSPKSTVYPLPAQQAGDGVLAGAAFQFLVLGGAGELLEGVLGLEAPHKSLLEFTQEVCFTS